MQPRLTDFDLSVQGVRSVSKPKPIEVDNDIHMDNVLISELSHCNEFLSIKLR